MLPKEVRRGLSRLGGSEGADRAREARRPEEETRQPGAMTRADVGAFEEAHPDIEVAPHLFPRLEGTATLADAIGGQVRRSGEGCFWLSEIPLREVWPQAAERVSLLSEHLAAWSEADGGISKPRGRPSEMTSAAMHEANELLFLDIETAGSWSAPLFLIGTLDLAEGEPSLRFFLARCDEEEPWLLEAFSLHRQRFPGMVTFNGRTFDWPYIADRVRYHRMNPIPAGKHLDLLPMSRKRWGRRLPNCKLLTLERAICRRIRLDDLRSEEVPAMYYRFVAEESPEILIPILRHNAWDLVSTAELFLALLSGRDPLE